MKIAIACDHGALELKNLLMEHLQKQGHQMVNFGTDTLESCDYPDFAAAAAQLPVVNPYRKARLPPSYRPFFNS